MSSDMEPRDVIAGALEILADEGSWTKGTEDRQELDDDGRVIAERSCLWGAFRRAVIPGYYLMDHPYPSEELWRTARLAAAAAELVGKIAREQYPDRMMVVFGENSQSVIAFNDHAKTVHSEVIAVLEKALAESR